MSLEEGLALYSDNILEAPPLLLGSFRVAGVRSPLSEEHRGPWKSNETDSLCPSLTSAEPLLRAGALSRVSFGGGQNKLPEEVCVERQMG